MKNLHRPSPALLVAVVALLLATGSTSYAAGLARNSVGTAQLKPDAVTAAKVKDGSLTGADVKDGTITGAELKSRSVGLSDLAPAAAPPRSIVLDRDLTDTAGTVELLKTPDFKVTLACDDAINDVDLQLTAPDASSRIEISGISSNQNSSRSDTRIEFGPGLQLSANDSVEGVNSFATFEGTLRASGAATMHVSIAVRMTSIPVTDLCSVRFLATPIS